MSCCQASPCSSRGPTSRCRIACRGPLSGTGKASRMEARAGLALVGTLLALALALACVGVAVDLALLGAHRQQLRCVCENAACAGATALHDPAVLYMGPERAGTPGRNTSRHNEVRRCVLHALTQTPLEGKPLPLRFDNCDSPDEDLLIGYLERPEPGQPLLPWHQAAWANTVQVQGWCREDRANAVSLAVGRFLGLKSAQLHVSVRATLEQRIAGFRPSSRMPVPLAPVGVCFQSGHQSWWEQACRCPATPGQNDRFRVSSQGRVGRGSDGIPEIELRIPWQQREKRRSLDSGNAWLLSLGGADPAEQFARVLRHGATARDLAAQGGRITLQGRSSLLWLWHPQSYQVSQVQQALESVLGQVRIWPLVVPPGEHGLKTQVVFFAAGQVVDVRRDDKHGQLIVWVQPALLRTPTALINTTVARNPWIGKVLVNQ